MDATGDPNSGVMSVAQEVADNNKAVNPDLMTDVTSAANWPEKRVFGVFFVLCSRPDGTILISEDGQ
jgi:hypothetical protein